MEDISLSKVDDMKGAVSENDQSIDMNLLNRNSNVNLINDNSALNITALHNGEEVEGPLREQPDQPPSISFMKSGQRGKTSGAGGLKENLKQVGIESGKACRICLDDTDTESNPFITPCQCHGSMRFIHVECLREW